MASKYLQKFPIPAGFQQILSDFTRQVLRDQPTNIIQYAAKYFQMVEKGKPVQFDSKYNVKKDEKKYELAYNAKNAQDIKKKASSITDKLNRGKEGGVPPSNQQVSSRHSSEHQSRVIGTQKTVSGEQTSNYVNNLSNNIAVEQENDRHIQEAIIATVDRIFEQIDLDNNGFLSSREIQRFVKMVMDQMSQGASSRPEDVHSFIEMIDNDRDGKISRKELADFILTLF